MLFAALAISLGGALACNALLGIQDVTLAADGGGVGAEGGGDPTCQADPSADPNVLREACGFFVAPSGVDDQLGSRAKPVNTLQRALRLASEANLRRVYVCEGVYETEALTIGAVEADHELKIFGSLSCTNGNWAANGKHSVVRHGAGPALIIDGAPDQVTISGIDFMATDATLLGQSSIAGYVAHSTSVVIRDATLTAGQGANGASAPAASLPTSSRLPNGIAGSTKQADLSGVGGGEITCTCTIPGASPAQTYGGAGSNSDVLNGESGGPPTAGGIIAVGGRGLDYDAGHTDSICGLDGAHDGGTGTDGLAGAPGHHAMDAGLGSIIIDGGWLPASGFAGENGGTGQGGGGGRGGYCGSNTYQGGGGGGCGGCGGTGGGGGGGGGASIALVINGAGVSFANVKLSARNAGNGGAGSAGAGGTSAGAAGDMGPTKSCSCSGGAGGAGGRGGNGGGGAGGLSVGVLYTGAQRLSTDGAIIIGLGQPGKGGDAGGAGAAPGLDGVRSDTLGL